ncbi:aspartate aminotransferase family protein [Thermoactinomyces sp. CICC 10521]|uniref:aspartate aminotransferase family protein n=1 Tax=Thermoactinomyces sp. CICC 10521 TaxID=2767426 RepID=UPI001E5DA15D|nr:aminotransferase class III-fold pyridoxal phosphate-dependent enzyme [Thermoactinomyces sp. CICC 10521]
MSNCFPKVTLSPVWPQFTPLTIKYARGIYLYDEKGRTYLDMTSGIGVTNTGHCHPRVVKAIQNQAEKLIHGQVTIIRHDPIYQLADELSRILPPTLQSYFFTNSGSEAVESAIKLARHATGKTNIICFQGGYHGRTVGAMSVTTAKTVYRMHYQPLMPGVYVAPFPHSYDEMDACLDAFKLLLATQTAPEETAAIIVEPVLGEGGYVIPPREFFSNIKEITTNHNILFIFDEIQTGFGRTGHLFAYEHFDVVPDVLIMAKGLGSGLPISGIAASHELMSRWLPGSHGGTYGGNPVACAAAVETIRIINEENLLKNAKEMGQRLLEGLQQIAKGSTLFKEVRGLGLMIGCEVEGRTPQEKKERAAQIRLHCLNKGLILLTCGTYDHVIRWIPPLTVQPNEIDVALTVFAEAIKEVDCRHA